MKSSYLSTARAVATCLAALVAPSVFAHAGHDLASGAAAGFMHPFTGLDHLLALIATGVLLASCAQRARWIGASVLTVALLFGAVLGQAGNQLRLLELILAFSVVVAGFAVALRQPLGHAGWLIAGMAAFATFHGYAHGAEATGAVTAFVVAFLAGSLVIVVAALLAAQRFIHTGRWRLLFGWAIAASGAGMLASAAL